MSAATLTTPVTIADRDVPRLLDERAQRAAKLKQSQPPRHQHRDSATGQDLPPLSSGGVADDSDVADAKRAYGDGLPRLPVPAGPQMNWLDPYVVWSLRDPRDTVFVKTTLWLSLGVLSSLYLVLVRFTWWHFALHAAWVGKHATTYVLMLHCVCHRPLYKAKYHALNWIAPYALGPFYGHTWDTFYFHHIKHHHIEDNGPHDLSSTLRYQRDSALHFFIYFSRFFLFTLIELPRYFLQKGWYATAVRVVFMEAATWSLFASLAYIGRNYTSSQPELVNFAATLTLAVPVALMRFGMMSGNWAQHAFVDRSRPDCDYVQSLTCINNPYNDLAFNDGYHTSHHLNPRRHWADHPGNLVACADDYAKHGTLVFTGIDFHVTWFYLMTKNYKALAQAYVHLDNDKPRPSDEEIMAMLKSRTKQMTQEEVDAYYSQTKTKLAARKTQ